MDNASFQKRLDILNAIRGAGHILLLLPPDSPQLNPIEPKWAQAQAIRKQKHGSISDIFTRYEIESFYTSLAILMNGTHCSRFRTGTYSK